MHHLFIHWGQIQNRLRSRGTIALFLDFDGTLARLQPRPDQVSLDGSVRQALVGLARSPRFRICIISGRRQADVRDKVRVSGVRYLGLHGWEGRGWEARECALNEETQRCLAGLTSRLGACLADVPGLWIEDKEYSLAVHYRGVAGPDVFRAHTMLDRIVEPCSKRFRIGRGKHVWEVLPRELEDKGAAVREQMALLRGGSVAVYLGDDQMDESAFAALEDGITVRVGHRGRTRARYSLNGVAEVRRFLQKLKTELT